ncbi:unnamed protein product [Clonostachys rosea f. rosea IK726]|uniref:Uncharacterized protein n=1 Tax=Clonostachys rosea f. rosea IK726 TaxID=1349383 RepID=A0ACA9UUH4_BIOOC|nr:unnamed protein product [Clonostachys rosea f. rosea IK726]
MASPPWHTEIALGLTQFYTKLAQAPYLSPDSIQHPPPEGWSDEELDVEGLRNIVHRSDAVVNLLRHLPYLKPVEAGPQTGQWCIFPKTKAIRYLRDHSSLQQKDLEGLYELVNLLPDMVSLTHPAGEYTHYGPQWWLVDCKTGRITKYAGPPRGEALAEEFEAEWKKAPTYAPVDFFQEVTTMLGKDYYPVPGLVDGIEADFCTPDRRESTMMYQIYMLAGWQHGRGPGPYFDREKCRKDLEAFLRDQKERESRKRKAEIARHERRTRPTQTNDPATYPDGYDRDVIATGLTRYYETLAQMAYFPASLIQHPPGGRWGDGFFLPADKVKLLGFNERVVDLLRHLPYLDVDESHEDNCWSVNGRSEPQCYLEDNPMLNEELSAGKATPENLYANGLFPFPEKMPEGLVPITGREDGEWWIIDTNAGTVIVYDGGNKQVADAPDDKPWLWVRPCPAGPFFDALVNSLHSLDLVPLPRPDTEIAECYPEVWGVVREEGEGDDEDDPGPEVEEAREIYRVYGWPDVAKFRRQECYDALVELRTNLLEDGEGGYGPA